MLRAIAVLTLASAAMTSVGAQGTPITLAEPSTVTVEGSSNVHDWHATTSALDATITMATPAGPGAQVEAVTLTIPVKTLKSGKDGLDKNMYKAMKADQYPEITFRLTSYESAPADAGYSAIVTGLLTVSGVERQVEIRATLSGTPDALKAVGSTSFRMTEFGIKPVTALFGTIRTKDEVTVTFELTGVAAKGIAELQRR